MKRHNHAGAHARRRRRRRHAHAVVAGAMLFAPHAARSPARTRELPQVTIAHVRAEPELVPAITITTEFRLPPHLAYETLIHEAAALHHVDPSLVRAVMRAES